MIKTNTHQFIKLHLLLHCLVVLSLNLDAIIVQLHIIISVKIKSLSSSTYPRTSRSTSNNSKKEESSKGIIKPVLLSSMDANLLSEYIILLQHPIGIEDEYLY